MLHADGVHNNKSKITSWLLQNLQSQMGRFAHEIEHFLTDEIPEYLLILFLTMKIEDVLLLTPKIKFIT